MNYIYSTLSTDMAYAIYAKSSSPGSIIHKTVYVKGGHGVVVAKGELITPYGAVTEISDEDLSLLEDQCVVFKIHKDNGYIRVEKKKVEKEKIVKEMKQKDKSAPITPDDFVARADGTNEFKKKD